MEMGGRRRRRSEKNKGGDFRRFYFCRAMWMESVIFFFPVAFFEHVRVLSVASGALLLS
jgi:hypothetical protein